MKKGKVFIVGEGPGDYKQITIKAFECLKKADVIIYDRILDSRILNYAKIDVILIDLTKIINESSNILKKIILEYVISGKTVIKLVCGDNVKLERDNEYIFLKDNEIEHEYINHVPLPIGVSLYSGIPIFDEDFLSSIHLIHKNIDEINYSYLAKQVGTIVIFSKYKDLYEICNGLIESGKSASTPVIVIINQYMTTQKFLKSDLLNISQKVDEFNLNIPIIIIIGDNLKNYSSYKFENKIEDKNLSLKNKKIVLISPFRQSDNISKSLEILGATVIRFPVIKVMPLEDEYVLEAIVDNLKLYKWIVFTSINSVRIFFKKIKERNFDLRDFHNTKFAVVGYLTNKELKKNGIVADFIPENCSENGLKEGLKLLVNKGDKVLLLKSNVSLNEFKKEFDKFGVSIDEKVIYYTKINNIENKDLSYSIKKNYIDFIAFTSPSTVSAFKEIMGGNIVKMLNNIKLIAIGPVTAKEMDKSGFNVSAVSDVYSKDGIVKKIEEISNGVN